MKKLSNAFINTERGEEWTRANEPWLTAALSDERDEEREERVRVGLMVEGLVPRKAVPMRLPPRPPPDDPEQACERSWMDLGSNSEGEEEGEGGGGEMRELKA